MQSIAFKNWMRFSVNIWGSRFLAAMPPPRRRHVIWLRWHIKLKGEKRKQHLLRRWRCGVSSSCRLHHTDFWPLLSYKTSHSLIREQTVIGLYWTGNRKSCQWSSGGEHSFAGKMWDKTADPGERTSRHAHCIQWKYTSMHRYLSIYLPKYIHVLVSVFIPALFSLGFAGFPVKSTQNSHFWYQPPVDLASPSNGSAFLRASAKTFSFNLSILPTLS